MITLTAPGVPAPQGSKTIFPNGGMRESSKALPAWRRLVNDIYVTTAGSKYIEGAVKVDAVFVMPRPKQHYGTGRNAGQIKPRYVDVPMLTKPDADKMLRAILDSLSTTKTQRGAYVDDAHVTDARARKRYVRDGETPHAQITLAPAYG